MLTSEVSTYVVQRTFSFLSFSYSQVYSVISAYIRLTWSFNNIFRNHFIDRMRLGPRLRALMTFLSPDVDVVTTFTLCRMFPGRFCLSQRQTRQREILLAFMVFWFCATSLRSGKDTQTNVHKSKETNAKSRAVTSRKSYASLVTSIYDECSKSLGLRICH